MLRRNLSISYVLLHTTLLLAQSNPRSDENHSAVRANVPFDKAHFADAEGLKAAQLAIRQGDAAYAQGGRDLATALLAYGKALAFNPDNAELNVKIGLCHLNGAAPHQALRYFQEAFALDPATPRIRFFLGYSYQLNARWDEAIAEFQAQRAIVMRTPDADRTFNMADKHIAECRNGKAAMAKPVAATVTALGPRINSEGPDYGALVTADGRRLMFTSRRNGSTGGRINKRTNEPFEDIYVCDRTATGWSDPVPFAAPVNTADNDASVGLFNDGRTLVIYRDGKGSGDLFESTLSGEAWSMPKPFPPSVNGPGHESSAWYTADRHWLYFTSDREGGLGGSDIYRSAWDASASTWGPAENLGPIVNTSYDEDGVFVAADGRTLYFGSRGHNTMGGFDLFRTTWANGTWSTPENLGWPVNSPGDDQFLVLTADGRTGYFSSTRAEGLGQDDLYAVELPAPPPVVDETALLVSASDAVPTVEPGGATSPLMLKGFVKGLQLMDGVEASIDLLDVKDARYVAKGSTDARTGAYTVVFPGEGDYALHVSADGFLPHSEDLPSMGDTAVAEHNLDIVMNPVRTGSSEVMRSVYFEPHKWALLPASIAELDRLLATLQAHPDMRLEVSGHTDNGVGGPIDNQTLSEYRAKAVVDHLVSKGIAPIRLVAKGYGDTRPLVPNDSDAHCAKNRRTEIRVL